MSKQKVLALDAKGNWRPATIESFNPNNNIYWVLFDGYARSIPREPKEIKTYADWLDENPGTVIPE